MNVKKQMVLLVFLVLSASAQWIPTDTTNIGITGNIAMHGNMVFQYGSNNGYRIYRSSNGGISWENISSNAPTTFGNIYSFGGELFGVYLGNVYVSTNSGDNWTLRSTVTVTGNGALWALTSNGSTLYAISNRKSFFVSTNSGSNWDEVIVNDPRNMVMVNFASGGGKLAAVFANVGALVSTNNGTSWSEKNPVTGGISGVYTFNNIIFGFSFGGGIYKMGVGDTGWVAVNNGIPDNGLYQIPKSMYGYGTTLYAGVLGLFSSQTKIYSSANNGASWDTLPTVGLLLNNTTLTPWFLAANQSNVFVYCYATKIHGVYSLTRTTNVEHLPNIVPESFSLEQNYPNPFNPSTVIRFTINVSGFTSLKVYDVVGREAATLVNENLSAGSYDVRFNASEMPSGVYFYTIQSGRSVESKRMILIK